MLKAQDAVARKPTIVLGILIALALLALGAYSLVNGFGVRQTNDDDVSDLISAAERTQAKTFTYKELVGLPEPVRRYFRYALNDNQPYVRYATFNARGDFRSPAAEQWARVDLLGHVSADRPGFVFESVMRKQPFVSVPLRDTYVQGAGSSSVGGSFRRNGTRIANQKPLNHACFQRWALEAVLLPTALLPSKYVRWKGLGQDSAKAILSDGVNRCELTFYFNDIGQITHCESADGYEMIDGRYRKVSLVAYRSLYKEVDGIQIPTRFSLVRILPGGKREGYWRGTVTDIEYNVFGR